MSSSHRDVSASTLGAAREQDGPDELVPAWMTSEANELPGEPLVLEPCAESIAVVGVCLDEKHRATDQFTSPIAR